MADGGLYWKTSFFGYNSAANCAIFAEFCMTMQNPIVLTHQSENLQNLEIQNAG